LLFIVIRRRRPDSAPGESYTQARRETGADGIQDNPVYTLLCASSAQLRESRVSYKYNICLTFYLKYIILFFTGAQNNGRHSNHT